MGFSRVGFHTILGRFGSFRVKIQLQIDCTFSGLLQWAVRRSAGPRAACREDEEAGDGAPRTLLQVVRGLNRFRLS